MKLRCSLFLLALIAAGCPSNEDPKVDPTPDSGDVGDPDSGSTDPVDPLYAIVTQVSLAGGESQSYLATVDDIEKEQTVGLEDAMELSADAYIIAGAPRSERFFLTSRRGWKT